MLTVVGLGPAGIDLLVPAARDAIERAGARFTRTARHPCVAELARAGIEFESFDALYERADDLDAVYDEIVTALLGRAARDDVLYAVPGSPVVAERTVQLLVSGARAAGVGLRLVPGLSFADLAWVRLGVDPLGGGVVVDGRGLVAATERQPQRTAVPAGRMLVAQCDTRAVLSDVKLVLLEQLDPGTAVTVLQQLGLPGERIFEVPLAELDHAEVAPDHLTSLFLDLPPDEAGPSWSRFVRLVERLRAPGGCPWDAEQTHHSLTRHLLEETYEVLEAIERLPVEAPGGEVPAGVYAGLEEELGDLLVQAVFHTTLAREADAFTIVDVVDGIHDKLVRRHPHVFGDVEVASSDEVLGNWEQIKQAEKGSASLMDEIPGNLPSLLYAHKLSRKAASVGLTWGSIDELLDETTLAVDRLRGAPAPEIEGRLGELLGAVANLASGLGVDAEAALRGWASGFRDGFRRLEDAARARGMALRSLDPDTLDALWHEVRSGGPGAGRE